MTAASSEPSGAPPGYRPDIDGLRAIAVVAVLGFHALPNAFPGGFVGVDIFFVISGYLISRLIGADLERGAFSYRRFYERRIRRIFPALAIVLVATAVAGWAFLLPDEWRHLGKHLFAGAAFVSNLALAREGGYFDWAAHLKPLLHLWSLGVEEQFYFVWPIFLVLLWKVRASWRLPLLFVVIAASFALNLFFVDRRPNLAFYLPVTRLWELALGSWLALAGTQAGPLPRLVRNRAGAELAAWSGLLLCIVPLPFLQQSVAFPGAWALLPTTGALLVIAAGSNASVNRLLASRPLVLVGLLSYPLYLWHWPLLSFARIAQEGKRETSTTVGLIAIAIVLAYLTYRFVESPIRRARDASMRIYAACGAIAIVALIGLAARGGLLRPRLDDPAFEGVLAAANDWSYPFGGNFDKRRDFERSTVKGDRTRAILFVGDSHLEHYWPRFEQLAANGDGPEMRFVTDGGCPPVPGIASFRGAVCEEFQRFALQEIRDPSAKTVVFGAAWSEYLDPHIDDPTTAAAMARFQSLLAGLVHEGRRVFVILPSPSSPDFAPRSMISRIDGRIAPRVVPVSEFLDEAAPSIEMVRAAATAAGATVIDPLPALCPAGQCASVTPDGRPIYKDWNHIRPFYAREHATFVDPVFAR